MKVSSQKFVLIAAASTMIAGGASSALGQNILVYDDNTANSYAQTAAVNVFGAGNVTIGNSGNFNSLLTGGNWDMVVVDGPSDMPNGDTGNMQPLINYVNAGGRAILSTWFSVFDDNPGLYQAFGANGGVNLNLDSSGMNLTVESAGTPKADQIFFGVPMPHDNWSGQWVSNGAAFDITGTGAIPLAFATGSGAPVDPIMISANNNRTIALFTLDSWVGPGAVELWENLLTKSALPAPGSLALLGLAGLVGARRRRH